VNRVKGVLLINQDIVVRRQFVSIFTLYSSEELRASKYNKYRDFDPFFTLFGGHSKSYIEYFSKKSIYLIFYKKRY